MPAPVTATAPFGDGGVIFAGAGPDPGLLGRQLLDDGSVAEAIVAFRQWAYHCPEDPMAHLHLGLALDRGHGGATARRAYRAALAALDRCDPDQLPDLEGYGPTELRKLLVARSAPSGDGPTP